MFTEVNLGITSEILFDGVLQNGMAEDILHALRHPEDDSNVRQSLTAGMIHCRNHADELWESYRHM